MTEDLSDVGLMDQLVAANRRLEHLCPLIRGIVEFCAAVELGADCSLSVSANPDIVLKRLDGHWVGITAAIECADGHRELWVPWRGSLMYGVPHIGTLQQVVDHYSIKGL